MRGHNALQVRRTTASRCVIREEEIATTSIFLLVLPHEIIDNMSSPPLKTFILRMCFLVRYSQPAAEQLFILTSAFKPNGIKIHQGSIPDHTKTEDNSVSARVSEAIYPPNNETLCGRHKL